MHNYRDSQEEGLARIHALTFTRTHADHIRCETRDNKDDLDLHVQTACKSHIFWNAKKSKKGEDAGHLDVDMNASDKSLTEEPVENVYFKNPTKGHYRVWVENNYKRTSAETKYTVRLTIDGATQEKTFDDIDEYEEIVAFEFDI